MENRDEFVNRSQGWVGVVKLNRKGDEVSEGVEGGDRVFLTAEEQTLTAQAHRRPEDSPFVAREITIFDPLTFDPVETFIAPLLEMVEPTPDPAVPTARRKPATAAAA